MVLECLDIYMHNKGWMYTYIKTCQGVHLSIYNSLYVIYTSVQLFFKKLRFIFEEPTYNFSDDVVRCLPNHNWNAIWVRLSCGQINTRATLCFSKFTPGQLRCYHWIIFFLIKAVSYYIGLELMIRTQQSFLLIEWIFNFEMIKVTPK